MTGPIAASVGDPNALEVLLASHGLSLVSHSTERLALAFVSAGEAVNFLVRTAGHLVAERERLTEQGEWLSGAEWER